MMHKTIVSTCSPNNNMHWVCIQLYRPEIPWRLFLLTAYVPMRAYMMKFKLGIDQLRVRLDKHLRSGDSSN